VAGPANIVQEKWDDRPKGVDNITGTLTGQAPLSVQEFIRKNAATFNTAAKTKEAQVFADARI
jgi:hypothetical protein